MSDMFLDDIGGMPLALVIECHGIPAIKGFFYIKKLYFIYWNVLSVYDDARYFFW